MFLDYLSGSLDDIREIEPMFAYTTQCKPSLMLITQKCFFFMSRYSIMCMRCAMQRDVKRGKC